jgi:aspartate kinase
VEEIQIWTDVDGILTADPRLVPGARRVRTLSFAEALEISSSGGKKPHPGTLGPASRAGVPIRILNSRHPESEGTLIGRRTPDAPPVVKSIACRPHDHLLYALPSGAEDEDLFLSGVLAGCERLRPSLMVLGTAESAVHLALDRRERLAEVRAALGRTAELGVLRGRAVVSLVSEDLGRSPELAERVLKAARAYDPRLVVSGAACPVVRCLVEEEDLTAVAAELHEKVFAGSGEVVE